MNESSEHRKYLTLISYGPVSNSYLKQFMKRRLVDQLRAISEDESELLVADCLPSIHAVSPLQLEKV